MDNLTENQWKKIIKKEGCAFEELYKVRGKYANTPLYLRLYISLLAKQEVFDDIWKIWSNRYGDDKTSNEMVFDMHEIIREVEKQLLGEKE
mgnify:FL=1